MQPKYVKMNNANEESFQFFCEEIKYAMNNMNWNTNLFHDPDHKVLWYFLKNHIRCKGEILRPKNCEI